jgi:hypothetical protein
MIFLIHLLQHMGLPSGVAIAVVIAARKLIKGVVSSRFRGGNSLRDGRASGRGRNSG